jgi:hypothetical protein
MAIFRDGDIFPPWRNSATAIFFRHGDLPPRRFFPPWRFFSATAIFRHGDIFPPWQNSAKAIFSAMANFRLGFRLWRISATKRIFTALLRHMAEIYLAAMPRPATEKF